MVPTANNSTARLAGNPDLSNAKTRAVLTPTHLSDPTCLVELIVLDELLGTGQRGSVLALVLQELQQLRGT